MSGIDLEGLLRRIAAGDKAALESLYREMERPIYRFILSRLNDPFRSADLVHDVFMEVWRCAGKFEGRSSVRTWIFAMAYRKVIDVFRKDGRLVFDDNPPEQVDESPGAEAGLWAAQRREAVMGCLGTLTGEHRAALELIFFEDMTYAEVAVVTGVPEGTVKSRVHHAKQLLLRCLSAKLGTEPHDD